MNINRNDTSRTISTQLDTLIPASKISTLTQGMFVGAISDNFGEKIDQKIFHCEIVVDNEAVKNEVAEYRKMPVIMNFKDENGEDNMEEQIQRNYIKIKNDVRLVVKDELE